MNVPNKKVPTPLTNNTKPPSFARFSIGVPSAKFPMLAGTPNPKATPNINNMSEMFKTVEKLAKTKVREENVPSIIHAAKNVVLLRTLSLNSAPARAENIAPRK